MYRGSLNFELLNFELRKAGFHSIATEDMFKKERDLTERSKTLLKNKEARALKVEIGKQFPRLNESEISELFPNKESVAVTKLANKTLVYYVYNVPLFFDYEDRKNIFPTLYTLWKYPHAIRVMVIHGPVSEYVLKGADLMLPGLASLADLEGLCVQEKISVRIVGNPAPIAVGSSAVSWEHILQHGKKGRGVEVFHLFGDELWRKGGAAVPNSGFGTSCTYPLEGYEEPLDRSVPLSDADNDEDEDEDEDVKGSINVNFHINGTGNDLLATLSIDGANAETSSDDSDDRIKGSDGSLETERKNVEEDEQEEVVGHACHRENLDVSPSSSSKLSLSASEEPSSLLVSAFSPSIDRSCEYCDTTVLDMDSHLQTSLLLSLKYIVKDKQLPMLVSTFWSILVKCTPAEINLDIKKSRHKKVSCFLRHFQTMGILTLKETNGEDIVSYLLCSS